MVHYGSAPRLSYWNGCSTGGRQGLRMAQDFPYDYDGILAGAPAIHWDRFQAGQIWYQVVMYQDNGAPVSTAKEQLATRAAVNACDALDGVVDVDTQCEMHLELRKIVERSSRWLVRYRPRPLPIATTG